jgi:hypothetical protein
VLKTHRPGLRAGGQGIVELVLEEHAFRLAAEDRRRGDFDRLARERLAVGLQRQMLQHVCRIFIRGGRQHVAIVPAVCFLLHLLRDDDLLERDIQRHPHPIRREDHPHRILNEGMRPRGNEASQQEEEDSREKRTHAGGVASGDPASPVGNFFAVWPRLNPPLWAGRKEEQEVLDRLAHR